MTVMVVLAVIAGIASFMAYRMISSTVSEFAELGRVPDLERSVRNQSAFAPPAAGELSPSQVARFVTVQKAVRARLGARFAEFEIRYRDLLKKEDATALDLPQLVRAYRDIATAYVDGKRAQVDALNEAGLSLQEYRWIGRQAYIALGMPMMHIDVGEIIDAIRNGRTPDDPEPGTIPLGPSGPAVNQRLVAPHRQPLEDNAPLRLFDL
jgi:hypothetical protein